MFFAITAGTKVIECCKVQKRPLPGPVRAKVRQRVTKLGKLTEIVIIKIDNNVYDIYV